MSENTVRIIFVHGFGGSEGDMPFLTELQKSINKYSLPFDVEIHRWDSGNLNMSTLAHEFLEAKETCEKEAVKLHDRLLEIQPDERCYVIGFSLGARISFLTAKCLKEHWPESLRGIILLGAALDNDEQLGFDPQEGRMLSNYHSKLKDNVLQLYDNICGKYAAGRAGLKKEHAFQDYTVQCSHTKYKDYSVLAEPVSLLAAWHANIRLEGKTSFNLKFPTLGGHQSWHTLYRTENGITIQQNAHTGHYRGITDTDVRVAWGRSLHGLLAEVENQA